MILVLFLITDAIRGIFSRALEIIDFSCLWSPWGWTQAIAYSGWQQNIKKWLAWRGRESLMVLLKYVHSTNMKTVTRIWSHSNSNDKFWYTLLSLRVINHCSNLHGEWCLVWLTFCKLCSNEMQRWPWEQAKWVNFECSVPPNGGSHSLTMTKRSVNLLTYSH